MKVGGFEQPVRDFGLVGLLLLGGGEKSFGGGRRGFREKGDRRGERGLDFEVVEGEMGFVGEDQGDSEEGGIEETGDDTEFEVLVFVEDLLGFEYCSFEPDLLLRGEQTVIRIKH